MRALKPKKDEENRIESVKKSVERVYSHAISAAEKSTDTSYSFDIDPHQTRMRPHQTVMKMRPNQFNDTVGLEYKFYKDNMEDILSGLQKLFPGCSVKLVNMCTGNDGKRYDISTMDEKMLPFINKQNAFECIVVDWS